MPNETTEHDVVDKIYKDGDVVGKLEDPAIMNALLENGRARAAAEEVLRVAMRAHEDRIVELRENSAETWAQIEELVFEGNTPTAPDYALHITHPSADVIYGPAPRRSWS